MPLDLGAVRQAARECGLREIYENAASRVVSFAGGALGRINVYYTTNTVATCIDHPRQGRTQLFRRGVSRDLLKQLMREPRTHTGDGYHRKRAWDDERPGAAAARAASPPARCTRGRT